MLIQSNPDRQGDLAIEGLTAAKAHQMLTEGTDRAVPREVVIPIDNHGYRAQRIRRWHTPTGTSKWHARHTLYPAPYENATHLAAVDPDFQEEADELWTAFGQEDRLAWDR